MKTINIKEFFKVLLNKMNFDENQTRDFERDIKFFTELVCRRQKKICAEEAEGAIDKSSILNSPIVKVD